MHHAICAVVKPTFESGFIDHSFANRVGKGTHRAIEAYERYRDRCAHVLRCDVYRYFPAIDHAILKSGLRRRIGCQRTLALLDLIVDGSNAQEPVELYFDGDDLFAPFRRRRGLPIGNLTSQFFANLYLDGFDHFATEILRAPYVRYVDDFALFHDDPAVLADMGGGRRRWSRAMRWQVVAALDALGERCYDFPEVRRMTITIRLEDEAARIVAQQVAEGRYPDAESAVTAAVMLLEDASVNWDDVDAEAVRHMIAESDAEGGEIPFEEVARRLAARDAPRQR